jgi:hypothetical protein
MGEASKTTVFLREPRHYDLKIRTSFGDDTKKKDFYVNLVQCKVCKGGDDDYLVAEYGLNSCPVCDDAGVILQFVQPRMLRVISSE